MFSIATRRTVTNASSFLTRTCGIAGTLLPDSLSVHRARQSPVYHQTTPLKNSWLLTYLQGQRIYYNCLKCHLKQRSIITISSSGNIVGLVLTLRKAHVQNEAWYLLSEIRSVQKEKQSLRMRHTNDEKKPSASWHLPAESSNGHLDSPAPSEFSETSRFDADWLRVKRLPPTSITLNVCRFTLQVCQLGWQLNR